MKSGRQTNKRTFNAEVEYTRHFGTVLKERAIPVSAIKLALTNPEKVEEYPDGTKHYLRRMPQHGNRWLRVIINIKATPNRAVTAFFDRRLRGE
jgi:transposase